MKFLVDMPLSPELAQWLRVQGHDAMHANDLSLHQSPDAEILNVASTDGHIVVTADLDFPRLLATLPRSIVVVDRDRIRRRPLPV